MSNSTTDFDDAGPSLPELDALARRSAAQLRTAAAGFTLDPPTRARSHRLLAVAAVVLLALLVGTVVVIHRGRTDRQRTVTRPGGYLFPSYVPRGLRFTGAYEAADGAATDPGTTTSTLSPAEVYATDDDARAIVAWAITEPGATASNDGPGQKLTVGGKPATYQESGGNHALAVLVGPGRTAVYLSRGLTRADLVAVAASAADHGVVPPAALPGLPPGFSSLGQVPAVTVLHALTIFAEPSSGVLRALGWQAGSKTLSVLQTTGDERTLRISTLLATDVETIDVDGKPGRVMDIGGLYAVSAKFKMAEVTWLDGGTQVVVDGVGLSRADVVRVSRSVRSVGADDYRRRVDALGGPLGAPEAGVVVVAQGGPPADVAAWRVTAQASQAGEELCLQRRANSGCSGQSTSISGSGTQTSHREPVDLLQLDRSGPPVILMGTIGSEVGTLRVNGKVVRPGPAFGSERRRIFAVAEPSATTAVTILATDRNGAELFRKRVSFDDPGHDPSTTAVAGGSSAGGSATTAPR